MPTESTYPKLDIPQVDLWEFLFERKDREFPDDKGDNYMLQYYHMGDSIMLNQLLTVSLSSNLYRR